MKPPHARPDPLYFPPSEPPESRLALDLLGLAAIVVVFFLVFFLLPGPL